MKFTWFGEMTIRLQMAGKIIVVGPGNAPENIDRAELISGADNVLAFADPAANEIDLTTWKLPSPRALIDQGGVAADVEIQRIASAGMIATSSEEGGILFADARQKITWGRWADGLVVILFGNADACASAGIASLEQARPKMIALACSEDGLDDAIARLRPHVGRMPLQVLEPNMAVEV